MTKFLVATFIAGALLMAGLSHLVNGALESIQGHQAQIERLSSR